MKNRLWFPLLIVSLGLVSWGSAQNTRNDLFDLKKSQQELEIMRGILSTTLSFVVKELQGKADSLQPEPEDAYLRSGWRIANISAFYLYGQGAVFVIPASNFRNLLGPHAEGHGFKFEGQSALFDVDRAERELELAVGGDEMDALNAKLAAMELAGVPGGIEGGVIAGVPGGVLGGVPGGVIGGVEGVSGKPRSRSGAKASRPQTAPRATTAQTPTPFPTAPPDAVATPSPPQSPPTPRSPDELRKKLADAQERVIKRREELAAKRAKFLEQLAQIKVYLIEALANHGDSLTHVKPNEYITIIITTDEGDFFAQRSQREVLSVQKSAVMDYKTGKITMEALKQKVLNYNN